MNRGKGEEMDGVFPEENQCRVFAVKARECGEDLGCGAG